MTNPADNVRSISAKVAEVQNLQDFLAEAFKHRDDFDWTQVPAPIPYLVDGVLRLGAVNIFAADGAAGKSQNLLDLALKVAYPIKGDTWLGQQVNHSGPVLYLSQEEYRDEFYSRLCDLGGRDRQAGHEPNIIIWDKAFLEQFAPGGNSFLFTADREEVVNTKLYAALREAVRILKPSLIVIDTLNSFCAVDIDKSTQAGQAVANRLGIIAGEGNSALVIPHHVTKASDISDKKSARMAIKGTNGAVSSARCSLVLWESNATKAKPAIEAGLISEPSELFMSAVVKANGKGADTRIHYHTKDGAGRLVDISGKYLLAEADMREARKNSSSSDTDKPKRGRGRPRKDVE